MANMYKLPRYSIFLIKDDCIKDPFKQGYTRIDENNESGEWVKWEDVEPLLKAYIALINNNKVSWEN
jgi:hypothetical protein